MMRGKGRIAVLAAACVCLAAVTGCASTYKTQYRDARTWVPLVGSTGGYWESKGPGELIQVGFSGNRYIDRETVAIYLSYRCAEVARREGHSWFAMYDSLPSAILDRRTGEKAVGTLGGKPSDFAYILLFDGPEPGLLSADEVISRLEPQVHPRGESK